MSFISCTCGGSYAYCGRECRRSIAKKATTRQRRTRYVAMNIRSYASSNPAIQHAVARSNSSGSRAYRMPRVRHACTIALPACRTSCDEDTCIDMPLPFGQQLHAETLKYMEHSVPPSTLRVVSIEHNTPTKRQGLTKDGGCMEALCRFLECEGGTRNMRLFDSRGVVSNAR